MCVRDRERQEETTNDESMRNYVEESLCMWVRVVYSVSRSTWTPHPKPTDSFLLTIAQTLPLFLAFPLSLYSPTLSLPHLFVHLDRPSVLRFGCCVIFRDRRLCAASVLRRWLMLQGRVRHAQHYRQEETRRQPPLQLHLQYLQSMRHWVVTAVRMPAAGWWYDRVV